MQKSFETAIETLKYSGNERPCNIDYGSRKNHGFSKLRLQDYNLKIIFQYLSWHWSMNLVNKQHAEVQSNLSMKRANVFIIHSLKGRFPRYRKCSKTAKKTVIIFFKAELIKYDLQT